MKRFSITELLRCPFFKPVRFFRELAEFGQYKHQIIEDQLKQLYPRGKREYDVVKQFVVDGELVEVTGRIDYVRFDEPIFYEIKPDTRRIPIEYIAQIWFYEYALREQTHRYYYGYLVLYDRRSERWRIVRPFIHNFVIEEWLFNIIRFRIKNKEPVKGGLCRFCEMRRQCYTRFRFDKYKGIIEEAKLA